MKLSLQHRSGVFSPCFWLALFYYYCSLSTLERVKEKKKNTQRRRARGVRRGLKK